MNALTRLGNALIYYAPLVLLVVAWDLSLRLGLMSRNLAPTPGATFEALGALLASGELWRHASVSLYRELTGLVLSIAIGTAIGIGMARIEWVRILIRPSVTFLYPMP